MNATEFGILVNEARAYEGLSPAFPDANNPYYFPEVSELGEGVDYQDEVFVDAPISNYNIGINGGTEAIKYSIGGGYFSQEGIIKNTDFNRASFRSNLGIKVLPNLDVNSNLSAIHSWAKGTTSEGDGGSSGSIVWGVLLMPPTFPIYDKDGDYTTTNPTPGGTPAQNPVAIANHYTENHEINRFLGSIDANWEIVKHLTLKVTFGADMSSSNREVYWPKETFIGLSSSGEAYQRNVRETSYLNENTLS